MEIVGMTSVNIADRIEYWKAKKGLSYYYLGGGSYSCSGSTIRSLEERLRSGKGMTLIRLEQIAGRIGVDTLHIIDLNDQIIPNTSRSPKEYFIRFVENAVTTPYGGFDIFAALSRIPHLEKKLRYSPSISTLIIDDIAKFLKAKIIYLPEKNGAKPL